MGILWGKGEERGGRMETSGGGGSGGGGGGIRFPFGFLRIRSRHCRQYRGKSPLHGAPKKRENI